jgi:pimeloyl-ACP methyl ester carboxylesterase
VPGIEENLAEIDGLPVFWRSAPSSPATRAGTAPATGAEGAAPVPKGPAPVPKRAAPVLYLHGVPSSSDEWLAFLERTGGLAPDLPGFGRSGKPGYLSYTIDEYASFIARFLDAIEVTRVRMVLHDWGAVGLAFAQAHPERIERLVIADAVPFLAGYRWHRVARLWRTPLLGELAMGATTRWAMRQATRESNVTPGPMPRQWIDSVMRHFDEGTQRAILRLYRSAPSEVLAHAGEHLDRLTMPTLVVWGAQDPYIPVRFAEAYAQALPHAQLSVLADAGHWWWLDRPDAIATVVEFLAGG